MEPIGLQQPAELNKRPNSTNLSVVVLCLSRKSDNNARRNRDGEKSPRWVSRIVVFTENNGNLALPLVVDFFG